ncbi:hypothetical protein [Ferrovibrio sp.]|uniref:hypothetical protein n=1 Tax=Ferrovibrio sp. TaxID=1917215 RepID=UPI001B6C24F0|nr:hypothetical protein [Ferrovibrio sp.]MBP7064094.1 hypothetical protein [Ferrovibrio sp.]
MPNFTNKLSDEAQVAAGQTTEPFQRKAWSNPEIEDADISAITNGSGTSGVEGPSFLKSGS